MTVLALPNNGEGPSTVFAPTDAAFEKLLKKLGITAEELLAREDLKDILLYHVLSGKVMSTDLKDGTKAETLAKKTVLTGPCSRQQCECGESRYPGFQWCHSRDRRSVTSRVSSGKNEARSIVRLRLFERAFYLWEC